MVPERDSLEVDVLFVGAGPASLAGAIHLSRLAKEQKRDISVMVIEKGGEIGHHGISGAVLDSRALDELLPDWKERNAPIEAPVSSEGLWFLTRHGKIAAPIIPPMMNNTGKYVASLQKITKWMGAVAEESGADVFASFPGQRLLWEGERVTGVRIGDKGVDHNGTPKSNYEPGPDIFAKITILGEGPRGTLAKQALSLLELTNNREPQVYALGLKELWQCAPGSIQPGSVVHTLNYPLPPETFGGGFIYGMSGDVLDVGFVVGLDYRDPTTDPHDEFQRFKAHPSVRALLEGAKLVRYGAKAIPEGGLFAMPQLYADGLMMIGDTAGFLNGMRLKGIHLAMKSGMLAAQTAFEALIAQQTDAQALSRYETKFKDSWAYKEMYSARNFHQGFKGGLFAGMLNTGLGMVSGGRGFVLKDRLEGEEGYAQMRKVGYKPKETPRAVIDNVVTFDKLTDVFSSGTMHE
ncbi:MAG: NAD(P)/FAD-dependent oxidoreductase, partial [Candidatus Eremiobacteraeota bacterium]|nr:NAD(P)/FAD-dependent oxidoreductase [Candidatus Eremiobacteraeota bacterium]